MRKLSGSEVLDLLSVRPEPDAELVDRLEDILALARSGDLRSFWCVGGLVGGDTMTSTGPSDDIWRDIGAIEALKFRMIGAVTDVD